jgi:hypothetical protein
MLVKPAIFLVLGVIAKYFCSAYIFESDQFDEYMNFMLKDYENASAAMLGLIPEFIVFVNLIISMAVHLFAIFLYKLLKSSLITSLIKLIVLAFCTFLFLGFCTMTFMGIVNIYEGYLIPSLIPKVFWIGYGCILLFIYFKSQKALFDFSKRSI